MVLSIKSGVLNTRDVLVHVGSTQQIGNLIRIGSRFGNLGTGVGVAIGINPVVGDGFVLGSSHCFVGCDVVLGTLRGAVGRLELAGQDFIIKSLTGTEFDEAL